MHTPFLDWAPSKTAGGVTEIAVLSPLRKGRPAGEKRTYEERALAAIGNLQSRVASGLPNPLNLVPSIHFGRIMLIRPEQYLLYSERAPAGGQPPPRVDEYEPLASADQSVIGAGAAFRSFLLTTVEFDGDLRVYFRDIDVYLNRSFDSLFVNCEDYPGSDDFEQFWLWIRRYQIETQLFYAAYPDLSVIRLKQLELFKRRFDAFVAAVRTPTGRRVASMDELFDQFLRDNQQVAADFPSPGGLFEPDPGSP